MFNLKDVEVKDEYGVLADGFYNAYVDKVEWKTSKAGANYLSAGFKTFGTKSEGRYVWNMWNLMHPKDEVQRIALQDIKRLLIAAGKEKELEGELTQDDLARVVSECRVQIKVSSKTDDYGTKNVIKGYESLEESTGAMSTPSDIPF